MSGRTSSSMSDEMLMPGEGTGADFALNHGSETARAWFGMPYGFVRSTADAAISHNLWLHHCACDQSRLSSSRML